MRGEEPIVVEALKMRALPESSYDYLLEFLKLYRNAVQLVVNRIWGLNEKLSKRKLHKLFYNDLVALGFRAHHAKEIYVYAESLVEPAKSRNGRKPNLRKLTARIDKYDYKLNLNNMTLTIKLHNDHEVKLKLLTPKVRVEKYKSWSNYELVVKYYGKDFWVSVYFKKTVKLIKPKTVMNIDVNFDNITLTIFTLNNKTIGLKRYKTPHRKILTHRVWIERIQKRYSKSWRFIKGVKRAIERHGERIGNISWDYAHKLGDLIAELALKHHSIVVLEDLDKLKENGKKKGRRFNKKLGLWFYRRIQSCIEYEAKERNLQVVKISPRGTSSKCPRCSRKLVENEHRILVCKRCGFKGDRDVVATINLYKRFMSKYSRCGVSGVALNAPKQMQTQEAMRGNKYEAMTIKLYKPI